MTIRNLDFLFRPRSIALVGASEREHSVGTTVMRNLLKGGFPGPIFPVHATRESVAGVHAYREVRDLPQTPDLGVICTPPDTVAGLVRSLGAQGTRAVAILTDGVEPEAVLAEAKPRLVRILGPNSMGVAVPSFGLHASFAPTPARAGPLARISPSGALLAAALDWAASREVGFSYAVSLGDAADVDAADVLDFVAGDPATRAVLLYLESVRDGRKFLSAARAAARGKPVIAMKSGRTPAGAQAALAHTGAPAGDDQAFDAAISRAGMLRVDTIAQLFDAAEALARRPAFVGSRLAILTNAGGPAVIAADALASHGGELAGAPIDLGGDAAAPRHADALKAALAASPGDMLLFLHGPSGVVSPQAVAEACREAARDSGRVLACWMGGERARSAALTFREAGIPVYRTPEAAIQAFLHMRDYRRNQESLQQVPESGTPDSGLDEAKVQRLLAAALEARREWLTDPEGKAILAAYGVAAVHTHVAVDADQAAALAAETGYPVALKVVSPDLAHRSEVGGVMLNLENEAELRAAAADIAARMERYRPDARLAGFTVQRMIRPPGAAHRRHGAQELLVSAAADPVFGRVMRLGRRAGLVPLNAALALRMLEPGTQGAPGIAAVLARISQILVHHPEIAELHLDPLLADEKGAMALEARMRVAPTRLAPGEHLAIRPYPRELEQRAVLKDIEALLRPIRPEDARAYAELIGRSNAEDLQMRFFRLVRRMPAGDLARHTQIDYDREMAFVAASAKDILGEVRLFVYPGAEAAEFALLVRTDMQRRGLGRALLEKAIDYCRSRGKESLIGQIQPGNLAMIGLARRCGMEVDVAPGARVAVAHLDLRPRAPSVRLF